jgi:hypothetical protein
MFMLIVKANELREVERLVSSNRAIQMEAWAPTTRKDVTPLNRKPGGLMEQSNASLQRGDQG